MAKFVPRQRKHKVLARERAKQRGRHEDTNQEEIVPEEKSELEKKKALLRQELQNGAKVSGKKAKRLDKYIETKLRKDEGRELLAKLAEQNIDTSLFSSSRTLGQGKETKKQAFTRALREENAGIDLGHDRQEILYERRVEPQEEGESGSDDNDGATEPASKSLTVQGGSEALTKSTAQQLRTLTIGAGLKRPLDVDDEGRPVLQKRQRRGGVQSKISLSQPAQVLNESELEEEWSGFTSDEDQEPTGNGSHADDDSVVQESDDEADPEGDSAVETASDGSSEDESETESDVDGEAESKERSSAFKAWAQQQRNEALGYQPIGSTSMILDIPQPKDFKPRPLEQDPLPLELQQTRNTARKAFSVAVIRSPEITEARLKLPVVAEEQKIMETIHDNDIVVICGSTGSGKTTQVPQFLYEAGYGSSNSPTPGMIGITQPRRVAAVSMSRRVAEELGSHSDRVAYQIRFEGTVDPKTAIKFMTDGVLLREVAHDIALRKYSAIIIDEAHERSVNTDILVGMLSRVIKLRSELAKEDPSVKPLKLIIMSATLRIEDLTENPVLFPSPPPVVEVEGRQHPVTIHFSRRTQHDYVEEAFRKVSRGHKKLPPGGILVFMTGQNEISQLSKQLKSAFGGFNSAAGPKVRIPANEAPLEAEDIEFGDVDDRNADAFDDSAFSDEEDEDDAEFDIEEEAGTGPLKMQVLPLYSLLPTREQLRVFETPPNGTRQVILATNVAETSLTIPGIRYVFDCGRSKERRYDRVSSVQSYEIGWISKASASQRSGRAGRTGPGHCYRLYSSAVYERDFQEFTDPELLRMPIEGIVLQLKSMRIQNVINFPFPTPPERDSLKRSEKLLTYLSAISSEGQVTRIGSTMSVFPLSPRFARILLVGHLQDCLPYTIALVAGLSAAEVFIPENQAVPAVVAQDESSFRTNAEVLAEDRRANIKRMFGAVHKNFCFLDDRSDAIKLLQVVGEFAHEPTEEWCERHFVRYKVLKEIQQLRRQIVDLLRTNIPAFASLKFQDQLDPPTAKQVTTLKQFVAAGFIDQVAIRADLAPIPPEHYRKPRRAIEVPYLPLIPVGTGQDVDKAVYIHPSSPLAHLSPQECPEYVIYAYLQRAATSGIESEKKPKTRMHSLTDITGAQLSTIAKGTPLLTFGKPIKEVNGSGGSSAVTGTVRECYVVPYIRAEGVGGQGWPLPMKKVKQRKVEGKGWVVE